MFNLTHIPLAIIVIAITILRLLKKTRLCHLVYHSDGQTQTKISYENLQEIECTAASLQHLETTINKLSTTTDRIHKEIDTIHHNIAVQQVSLELLNKLTSDNLQTTVDAVHQLIHITQNTQNNTQTTVQKITKFQEIIQTNILLTTELSRRNSR